MAFQGQPAGVTFPQDQHKARAGESPNDSNDVTEQDDPVQSLYCQRQFPHQLHGSQEVLLEWHNQAHGPRGVPLGSQETPQQKHDPAWVPQSTSDLPLPQRRPTPQRLQAELTLHPSGMSDQRPTQTTNHMSAPTTAAGAAAGDAMPRLTALQRQHSTPRSGGEGLASMESMGSGEHAPTLQRLLNSANTSPAPSSCGGGGAGVVRGGPWGPSSGGMGRLGSIDETEAVFSAPVVSEQEWGGAGRGQAKGTARTPAAPVGLDGGGSGTDSGMFSLPGPPSTALQLAMSASSASGADHDHSASTCAGTTPRARSSPLDAGALAGAHRPGTSSSATPLPPSHRMPTLSPIVTAHSAADHTALAWPNVCAEQPLRQQELMVVEAGSSHESHAHRGSSQVLSANSNANSNDSSALAALRAAHAEKAMTVHGGSFFFSAVNGQGAHHEGGGGAASHDLNLQR
ncbi:hypothetical protein DUNSADRAFT_10119 [Dunaliella salina]|nr:hypothetical protein DUNSADRAFT_10119 [Dunaliella salina]|eukprot:KAF5841950.1 hypothetical protein DUNSADRAFT_10119 [Dunaliella salina]